MASERRTRVPPAESVAKISSADASKLNEANWRTRSPFLTPNQSAETQVRFVRDPCSISTPLGLPVEPEV